MNVSSTKLSDHYSSPLSSRYASREMSYLFSPQMKYLTWRQLWIALAEGQKKLGLDITNAQLEELKAQENHFVPSAIAEYEKKTNHEVMAHIHAYSDLCPKASSIIHLGATSSFVMDNGDLIQIRCALELIRKRLVMLLEKLHHQSIEHISLPCLSYTHFQPALPTTVGKRFALYLQDFLQDFLDLQRLYEGMRFLGVKGATGTQDSFLELFDGDHEKVVALDRFVTEKMGFTASYSVVSQTYPRKFDMRLFSSLANIAASAHKFATDLRLLAHEGEWEEPKGESEVGSSAMPHKRNPILSERICSLSRYVISMWDNGAYTASNQWLERSLDDSANRRLSIPEAFLATESVLNLLCHIMTNLVVKPENIEANLKKELPRLALEKILMAAVKKGKNRQEIHERLRLHAVENLDDLSEALIQDEMLGLTKEEISALLSSDQIVGRSSEQTLAFLRNEVEPILSKFL